MTEAEYIALQRLFSNKVLDKRLVNNREQAYNEGILTCKSILRRFYRTKNQTPEELINYLEKRYNI